MSNTFLCPNFSSFSSFQKFSGPNHRKQKQHCLSRSLGTAFRSSPCKSFTGLLQFQQSFCGNEAAKPWRYIVHLYNKKHVRYCSYNWTRFEVLKKIAPPKAWVSIEALCWMPFDVHSGKWASALAMLICS